MRYAVLFLCLGSVVWGAEADFTPHQYEEDRYSLIWERSPFVVGQPVVASSSVAQRFALTGMAALQDEPVVFVLDRQSLSRIMVTRQPNPAGIALVSVERHADPLKSQATIRVGNEVLRISYDPAALQASATTTAEAGEPRSPALSEALTGQHPSPNAAPRPARTIKRTTTIKLTN
jgi:hypothetical protein